MDYLSYQADVCNYPRPRVPLLPQPALRELSWQEDRRLRALLDAPQAQLYRRARYALRDALAELGAGPGRSVLMPAYHCRTMLDPALRLQADVRLYQQHEDLSPDLAALQALLSEQPAGTCTVVLTHYFGAPNPVDWPALQALCARHKAAIVEDCAHVLFAPDIPMVSGALGLKGDCSVASPYKFFPLGDGALLWWNRTPPRRAEALHSRPGAELRAVRHWLGAKASPTALEVDADWQPEDLRDQGPDQMSSGDQPSGFYDAAQERDRMPWAARTAMAHARVEHMSSVRRSHHAAWARAVSGLPHCQAFMPELPAGCTPYMFALRLERPEVHFHWLKRMGLPIWRWDDMARSDCEVASRYRLQLLHLPCHQGLSDEQLNWMFDTVAQVLRRVPVGGPA